MTRNDASPSPFDLERTQAVARLFATPREGRDEEWGKKFLIEIPRASMMSFDPQVIHGPDGFPYFRMSIPDAGKAFTPFSIAHVLAHCCDTGVGAVIFENSSCEGQPGWVFSLGDLASYRQFRAFDGDPLDRSEQSSAPRGLVVETIKERREIFAGAPAEGYLPPWSRRVLGAFLRQAYGIESPKVALVVDPTTKPSRNLMLNVSRDKFASADELRAFFHKLSWFLPRGRGFMLKPDSFAEGESFVELS